MEKKSWKDLISENEFWKILDNSLKSATSISNQMELLKNDLQKMSLEEIVGFCYYNYELYRKAYKPNLWAASYIAMKGCGDSSFHYFRCWLITRGEKVYYSALSNPDSLVTEFENYEYEEDIQFDFMAEFARQVYYDSKGKDLDDIIEKKFEQDFKSKSEMELSELIVFDWSEDDTESQKRKCPKIFERFWDNPLKSRISTTEIN